MRDFFPDDLSRRFIQTIYAPAMFRHIGRRVDVAEQAMPEDCLGIAAHGCRHINPVAPDYRTRMSKTGNLHLPRDVYSLWHIPMCRSLPSATPDAPGPRNDGQFWAESAAARPTK